MTSDLVSRLQARIQEKSLLRHPFYQDWQQGKLSLEDLRVYAAQYYRFESTFPMLLSAVHSRCPEPRVRQAILSNLWDEEHGPRNHVALWLQFAAALGMSSGDVHDAVVFPETRHMVETLGAITSAGAYQEGLAALYAYEHQVPAVAAEKVRGLREFYGVTAPQATEFFAMHMRLDAEHSSAEAAGIAAQPLTPQGERAVERALDSALDALWGFLDGVQRSRMERAAALA